MAGESLYRGFKVSTKYWTGILFHLVYSSIFSPDWELQMSIGVLQDQKGRLGPWEFICSFCLFFSWSYNPLFVALNFGCFRNKCSSKLSTRYTTAWKSSSSNITCVSEICLLFTSQWFENLAHLAIWVVNGPWTQCDRSGLPRGLRTARTGREQNHLPSYLVMGPASYCTESTPKKEPHYILILTDEIVPTF